MPSFYVGMIKKDQCGENLSGDDFKGSMCQVFKWR